MRRTRGFSLTELMVALALAGIVVAGAMQLHMTFQTQSTRQNQVAEVQQTLRNAMAVLARYIRASGSGMINNTMALPGCATSFSSFRFRNARAFPSAFQDPVTSSMDSITGDFTSLPDELKVLASDDDQMYLATNETGNVLTVAGGTTQSWTTWAVGDVFVVLGTPASTAPFFPATWVREVTSLSTSGTPKTVTHAASAAAYNPCANPASEAGLLAVVNTATTRMPVKHFGQYSQTYFRVQLGTGAAAPRLVMQQSRPNKATSGGTWITVAENIEDLQIAVLLDNGRICFDTDDPAKCDFARARAVRITLVGRSPIPIQGLDSTKTRVGGYEDRTSTLAGDQYLRRAMTAEIELRN